MAALLWLPLSVIVVVGHLVLLGPHASFVDNALVVALSAAPPNPRNARRNKDKNNNDDDRRRTSLLSLDRSEFLARGTGYVLATGSIALVGSAAPAGVASAAVAPANAVADDDRSKNGNVDTNNNNDDDDDVLRLDLIPLTKGGCLVTKVSVVRDDDDDDDTVGDVINGNKSRVGGGVSYYATVDTGSPFLTAPPSALPYTRGYGGGSSEDLERGSSSGSSSDSASTSQEQYGQTSDEVRWRTARTLLFAAASTASSAPSSPLHPSLLVVLGIATDKLVEETGGLFMGLMYDDDGNYGTFLRQAGYRSFELDWPRRRLTLSRNNLLMATDGRQQQSSGAVIPLYELSRFGPNLHHYAVKCDTIAFTANCGTGQDEDEIIEVRRSDLDRDIVVVLDSGLTGCILSDSWRDVLDGATVTPTTASATSVVDRLTGATIRFDEDGDKDGQQQQRRQQQQRLPVLRSDPKYWYLSCFRLPWFTEEEGAPHVVAAGATFLRHCRLVADGPTRTLRLDEDGGDY